MNAESTSPGEAAVRFGLAALAVWRVAHLIVGEDGPWAVIARVRARLGDGVLGQLVDCFACTSVWVAAPAAAVVGARRRRELPLVWLALSGAACLVERVTERPEVASVTWPDAQETPDGA